MLIIIASTLVYLIILIDAYYELRNNQWRVISVIVGWSWLIDAESMIKL